MFQINRDKFWIIIKAAIIAVAFFGGTFVLWAATLSLPDIDNFEERRILKSTKIYDRTGEILLFDFNKDIQRTPVELEDISDHVKNASIAVEDAEFYSHHGVRPLSFIRAIWVNVKTKDFSQGGSTITQQVVKNALLNPEKLISRKIKEWILAIRLEQEYNKDEILEIYLNEVPFGGTIYGVEEAAESFFGVSAKDLTIAQSAFLAALPQAPTYYSPYGNHREELKARQEFVLHRMLEEDFITEEEYQQALEEEVEFLPQTNQGIKAPHFVFYIREYLEKAYGTEAVEEGGLNVITTIDYELQVKGEDIVNRYALENARQFNAENAALVAVDPRTGQIITMVGSRNFFDEQIDGQYNASTALRQPGSAFKPFIYATAFKKGYTPETVVFDVPTQFSTACSPSNFTSEGNCYSPGNYDNTFRGPMTLRNALAQSVNIPAVKAFYLAGLQDSLQTAQDLGITSLGDVSRYGLTLVLGGGEVSLLEMTGAYGVFANEGTRLEPTGILKIEDLRGNVLEEYEEKEERVLEPQIARLISDVLSDNIARTPAFGANSFLHFPGRDVAVKTGTTNDYRDAWIVGYTPTISVGAWAGNNDSRSMEKRVAGFIIAPLWNEFMYEAFEKYPNERFTDPEIDYTGLKPILRGVWQGGYDDGNGVSGGVHSILHWVDKNNPRGPYPHNPGRDPQYGLWEYSVQQWYNSRGFFGSNRNNNRESDEDDSSNNTNRELEDLLEELERELESIQEEVE